MPHLHHGAMESLQSVILLDVIFAVVALVYLRGWLRLRPTSRNLIAARRASSFFIGMFLIWVALASPLAGFDHQLLTAHMAEHLLLMTLAPPLMWLGAPIIVLRNGLPQQFIHAIIEPALRLPAVQRVGSVLLAGRSCGARRMAHSRDIYSWAAIRSVAHDRARILPCSRASLLVARRSALAECLEVAGNVGNLVSLSRHTALRHPFRISGVLRPGGLHRLFIIIAALRTFCARRSAVRGCADVDLRHSCLPLSRSDSHDALALAAEFVWERVGAIGMARQCGDAKYSAQPGSSLSNGH